MKVLDLQCANGHMFEGWFASHEDYDAQRERGMVSCPACGDEQVARMPSAPRLNLSHAEPVAVKAPALAPGQAQVPAPAAMDDMPDVARHVQAAYFKMVRHVMSHTEDVGDRFAQEARKIHYGEREERGIRGHASPEETRALLEEGIDILPLAIPEALKEPLQ